MLEGFTPHKIDIYSVTQDGLGQETITKIKSQVKCRLVRGIEATRDYLPAYRTQENIIYKAACWIPHSEISDIVLDYGYIIEYNGISYKIQDIYEGIDFSGMADYIKLGLI